MSQDSAVSDPKTITTFKQKINSYSEEGCHHLDLAILTPTVGDHCKGERIKTSKHKQEG